MRDPENMRLWYTTPKTAMRRLESSRKSRNSVSASERDCIHNTLYYTSNKVNSQQPFSLSIIATATAKQPHGPPAKGKPSQGWSRHLAVKIA